MRRIVLCCVLIVLAPTGVHSASSPGAAPPEPGLVRVPSRTLDELYRRAGSDLTAYRRVVIDDPEVRFKSDWLKRMNESRGVTRWIPPAEAEQIAQRMAIAMREAVGRAFAGQGYDVVTAAAPGVLRVAPSVTDLDVYAPFAPAPGIDVGIVHQDAGEATMRLEVRDAESGTLLARMVDHDAVRTIGGFEQATSVSNLFWFEGMFRHWADDCVREIRAGSPRP